jgi:hypothetical protein
MGRIKRGRGSADGRPPAALFLGVTVYASTPQWNSMSEQIYISDRERGPTPRTVETINVQVWKAVGAEIYRRLQANAFGLQFPLQCSENPITCGTDEGAFRNALLGQVPDLGEFYAQEFHNEFIHVNILLGQGWNGPEGPPSTLTILDAVQFSYRNVAEPFSVGRYHGFLEHSHLRFNAENGRASFRQEVNLIFARNGLAYELEESGEIVRLATPELMKALRQTDFRTGDGTLDALLTSAVKRYLNPDIDVRQTALEKLWDAWERLKSLEDPDKKVSTKIILDRTAPTKVLREIVEKAAENATFAGNQLLIRHSEKDREPVGDSAGIDFLFHSLFSLVRLILERTGRTA